MRYAIDMIDMVKGEAMEIIKKFHGVCSIDEIGNYVGLFDTIETAQKVKNIVTEINKEKSDKTWKPKW